jgi:hypothetical protein
MSRIKFKFKVKVILRLTVSQSVSFCVEPHLGLMTRYFLLFGSYGLFLWGALSDERTGLSFTIAADPRQRSHSRVRVPWDSRPYFTVSDSRLTFSSTPMTRRATVEVFDPPSTRDSPEFSHTSSFYNFGKDRIEATTSNNSFFFMMCLFDAAETCLSMSFYCWKRNLGNVFNEALPSNGHMPHNV